MSREDFEVLKELAKQTHDERVAKTPDRVEYAKKRFELEKIPYKLKNPSIGHFHVFDKHGNLFQFWASTGKIYYDKKVADSRHLRKDENDRGIETVIFLVKGAK